MFESPVIMQDCSFAKREVKNISRGHSVLPFCILTAVSAACPNVLVTLFAVALVLDVCNASELRLSLLKWQLGIRHPGPRRFAGPWHHCKTLPWWCFWCCDSLVKTRNPGYVSPFLFAIYNKTWFVTWQFLISAESVPSQVGWLSRVISRVSLPSSWYLLIFFFFVCVAVVLCLNTSMGATAKWFQFFRTSWRLWAFHRLLLPKKSGITARFIAF